MVRLNPWYIVGFVEGEGCFAITISKHKTKKLGLDARLVFEIELREDDRPLLGEIRNLFKVGHIYRLDYRRPGWSPHTKYSVHSLREIKSVIIPFFKKYPLKGRKKKSFEIFCQAVTLFEKKEHLTEKGIKKLRKLRISMNQKKKRDH